MKFTLLTLALVLGFASHAQLDYDAGTQAISAVKEGILVVRLYNQTDELNYLQENGKTEEYNVLLQKVEANNRAIRQAFENEYNAGRVYFMNARNSSSLIRENWEGIFTDVQGNMVEVEVCPYVLVDISTSKNLGLVGLNAWIWTGEEWAHPSSPFPSFISRYGGFLGLKTRSYSEMVEIFNRRLGSRG